MKKEQLIDTPKFDKLLDFVVEEAQKGTIERSVVIEFQNKIKDAVDELGITSIRLMRKATNRVGWIAFFVGVFVATTGLLLVSLIF